MIKESLMDSVAAFSILKSILQPFSTLEAFKLGLIDMNGKRIRKAKSDKEKKAVSLSNRITINLKRLLGKVLGGTKTSKALMTAYLLKENCDHSKVSTIVDTIDGYYYNEILESMELTDEEFDFYYEGDLIDV